MLLPWLSFLPASLWKLLQALLQAAGLLLWLFFMCWSTCCNCCCHIPNGTGAAPSAVAPRVITAPAPLEFLCHTAVQLLLLSHTTGAAVVAAAPHHWCRCYCHTNRFHFYPKCCFRARLAALWAALPNMQMCASLLFKKQESFPKRIFAKMPWVLFHHHCLSSDSHVFPPRIFLKLLRIIYTINGCPRKGFSCIVTFENESN